MSEAPPAVHQRSRGEVLLSMGEAGVRRMREAHAAKLRIPQGSREAILINTGGGLAGGDRFDFDIAAEARARLTVTSQAAERVYRSLGPAAEVGVKLRAEAGSALAWLPQETILFDGSALSRRIDAELAADARLLAVESFILGREAMGETVASVHLRDRWRVTRGGSLAFADDVAIGGKPPGTAATLGSARAFATVLLVSQEAEDLLDPVRAAIGGTGGASAWNGKLVARLVARDGFELRKSLIPALSALNQGHPLPKVWSF